MCISEPKSDGPVTRRKGHEQPVKEQHIRGVPIRSSFETRNSRIRDTRPNAVPEIFVALASFVGGNLVDGSRCIPH
jgi:hypothetical protein